MIAHEERDFGSQMSKAFVGCGTGAGKRRHNRPLGKSPGCPGHAVERVGTLSMPRAMSKGPNDTVGELNRRTL
jgi:hypothetical protein